MPLYIQPWGPQKPYTHTHTHTADIYLFITATNYHLHVDRLKGGGGRLGRILARLCKQQCCSHRFHSESTQLQRIYYAILAHKHNYPKDLGYYISSTQKTICMYIYVYNLHVYIIATAGEGGRGDRLRRLMDAPKCRLFSSRQPSERPVRQKFIKPDESERRDGCPGGRPRPLADILGLLTWIAELGTCGIFFT